MMPSPVAFSGATDQKCGLCEEEIDEKLRCFDWSAKSSLNRTFAMWAIALLLFFCHLSAVKGEKESKITRLVEEAADLPCDADKSSCGEIYFITWTKNVSNEWKRLYLYSESVEKPLQELANPDRADFFVKDSTAFLRIFPLRIEDDGIYKCDVTYVQGKCPSLSYATLVIHATPRAPVIEKDGKISPNGSIVGPFLEGTSLSLVCETSGGKPTPEVTWFMAEKELVSESEVAVQKNGASTVNSTVHVTLQRDDLGKHLECHVDNEATDSPLISWVELDLHVGPSNLDVSGPTVPVTAGEKVTFSCVIEGAKPAGNAAWFNKSSPLQATPQTQSELQPDGTFKTISEVKILVSRHDHLGNYFCKGTNSVLESKGEAPLLKSLHLQVLYPPAVVIHPEGGIIANESDNAILYCKYEANPFNYTDVHWFHGDKELEVPTTDKYVPMPRSEGYPTLAIKNIAKEDRGMYSCTVSNSIGTGNSTNDVEINVLYPPIVIAVAPSDVNEGSSISFFCNIIGGNPQNLLRVRWFKDNEWLHETTEREIVWVGVTRNTTGNYSCEGENVAGWGERSEEEELVVNYLPGSAVLMEMDAPSVKGEESVLRCDVEDPGLPSVNLYRWEKEGMLVATTSEEYLNITNTRVNTTGNYSCAAVNDVGAGPKGYFFLQVYAPPYFIQDLPKIRGAERDAPFISLTCRVECVPMCAVQWMKDDVNLPGSELYIIRNHMVAEDPVNNRFASISSTLQFNTTAWPGRRLERTRDKANYTCSSTPNEVGDAVTSTTQFLVEYPPESLKVSEPQVNVVEGKIPEVVKCSASSWPRSTFYWKKENSLVSLNHILDFNESVTRENDGEYICVARNDHGEAEIPMKLNVLYKPECRLTESTDEKGEAILVCTAKANPSLINFTWFKDNDTLLDDFEIDPDGTRSTYQLHGSTDHYGLYICIVINDIGESEPCEKTLEGPGAGGWNADFGDKNVLLIAAVIGGIAIIFVLIIIIIIVIMRKRRLQNAASPAKQAPVTGGENLYQNVSGAPSDRKQNGPPVSEQEGNVMYENMPFHRQGPYRPDSTDEMVYADIYDDVKTGKLPDPRLKPPLPPKGIGKKPKEPPLPPKTKKGGSDLL